jgi:hypothetical protein
LKHEHSRHNHIAVKAVAASEYYHGSVFLDEPPACKIMVDVPSWYSCVQHLQQAAPLAHIRAIHLGHLSTPAFPPSLFGHLFSVICCRQEEHGQVSEPAIDCLLRHHFGLVSAVGTAEEVITEQDNGHLAEQAQQEECERDCG